MCGIAVYAGPVTSARVASVERASGRLAHRGPDDKGLHCTGGAIVAHNRLSIIDLDGGRQPLLNEDGRLALVANGEIYNHAALRARLSARHRFATRVDAEVILHLYEERGPACVFDLTGMFAFVLTDGERVFAARDPLGIKPLYLGRDDTEGLWFASELKALGGVCRQVEEFPAGTWFESDCGFRRWFTPPWANGAPDPASRTLPALSAALEQSVERRLMSDVPIGVLLSGGLDSSIIATLVRPRVDRLHTFSVGLEGAPDLAAAREMARHLGAVHHERTYTVDEMVARLETIIYHLESYDPALIRSAVPTYFVSELAADHVKVVLCGEGADEAFAGYRYFGGLSDPDGLQQELVRSLFALHNLNLQRVDRMTMAHAIEARVPFLDVEFLSAAMAIDPRAKLHTDRRAEKWLLRRLFDGRLPDAILWRPKAEFAAGCGAERALAAYCARRVSDTEFMQAARRYPADPPASKEAFLCREIFDRLYPGEACRQTVGRWDGDDVVSSTSRL